MSIQYYGDDSSHEVVQSVTHGGVKVEVIEKQDTPKLLDMKLMGCRDTHSYEQVKDSRLDMPSRTDTHVPIAHHELLDLVRHYANDLGFEIVQERHAMDRENQRYFGMFQINSHDNEIATIMGLRNSHDKSIPIGVSTGNAPFICANGMFNNENVVHTKHTARVWDRLPQAVFHVIYKIKEQQYLAKRLIERMKDTFVGTKHGDSIIWEAVDNGIVTYKQAHDTHKQWHEPEHDVFTDRNVWSLQNAFTNVLRGTNNRHTHLSRTTKIRSLLDKEFNLVG